MELVIISTIAFLVGFLLGRLPEGKPEQSFQPISDQTNWELLKILPEEERIAVVRRYFDKPTGAFIFDQRGKPEYKSLGRHHDL